jgi:uncharacterized protein with PQ loop repeat
MIETIGYIASILFAVCGFPLAWRAYKTKTSDEPWSFLLTWLAGEILMQVYVLVKHGLDLPLLAQYWANTVFLVVILYYKIRSRNER